MSTATLLPADHPLRRAWEAYKASDDYPNTRRWALVDAHVDGSLWAAFAAGFDAALTAWNTRPSVVPEGFKESVAFLLDRLDEFESAIEGEEDGRQFHGHVVPAKARLRSLLSASGEG